MASQPRGFSGPSNPNTQKRRYQGQGSRTQKSQKETRVRPTHFIAIPLNTNPHLRHRISSFQNHILSASEGQHGGWIRGLHPSIVINPVRFHLTIGVMGLKDDTVAGPASTYVEEVQEEAEDEKTVSGALDLLRSLKPQMQEILASQSSTSATSSSSRVPLRVRLDHIEVMRLVNPPKAGGQQVSAPGSGDVQGEAEMWADVLYLAPKEDGVEGRKLRRIGDLINSTFRKAGYLTDTRPLKLHCTILNTSHRKPSRDRKLPFCYSDILGCEEGMKSLFAQSPSPPPARPLGLGTTAPLSTAAVPPTTSPTPPHPRSARNPRHPHPQPQPQIAPKLQLGTLPHPLLSTTDAHDEWMEVEVKEVGLWKMGSWDREGRYVSCGSVGLGV